MILLTSVPHCSAIIPPLHSPRKPCIPREFIPRPCEAGAAAVASSKTRSRAKTTLVVCEKQHCSTGLIHSSRGYNMCMHLTQKTSTSSITPSRLPSCNRQTLGNPNSTSHVQQWQPRQQQQYFSKPAPLGRCTFVELLVFCLPGLTPFGDEWDTRLAGVCFPRGSVLHFVIYFSFICFSHVHFLASGQVTPSRGDRCRPLSPSVHACNIYCA